MVKDGRASPGDAPPSGPTHLARCAAESASSAGRKGRAGRQPNELGQPAATFELLPSPSHFWRAAFRPAVQPSSRPAVRRAVWPSGRPLGMGLITGEQGGLGAGRGSCASVGTNQDNTRAARPAGEHDSCSARRAAPGRQARASRKGRRAIRPQQRGPATRHVFGSRRRRNRPARRGQFVGRPGARMSFGRSRWPLVRAR